MTYIIGQQPRYTDDVTRAVELLRGRSTGTLGHWKSLEHAHGLSPLVRPAHAVGEVVTAKISAFDSSPAHYAVSLLEPGDVLVIDTSGETKRAPWGGATSYAAFQASAAGVIIDGPITDWDEITTMGVQTWSRGTTTLTFRPRSDDIPPEGGVNIPVNISGALVSPGDIAFADSDGVVFLGRDEILSNAEKVLDKSLNERHTWRELAKGTLMYDTRGQRDRFENNATWLNNSEKR